MSEDPSSSSIPQADAESDRSGLRKSFGRFVARLRGNGGSLRESLEEVLEEHESGAERLSDDERLMLFNIINLRNLRVEDVMVPRADIKGMQRDTSISDAVMAMEEAGHTRLPVYGDTLDDVVGMVHIKDMLRGIARGGMDTPGGIQLLIREILFVPPSMPVVDLLLKMRQTRTHLAMVIDEYGGADGLVTIEDLIEEIVGEIEETEDDDAPRIRPRSGGGYDMDARVELDDLEQLVSMDLLPPDEDEQVDTVGGLVFSLAGHVPTRGEVISHPAGLDFEIIDADARRVKRLRVRLRRHNRPAASGQDG